MCLPVAVLETPAILNRNRMPAGMPLLLPQLRTSSLHQVAVGLFRLEFGYNDNEDQRSQREMANGSRSKNHPVHVQCLYNIINSTGMITLATSIISGQSYLGIKFDNPY